MIYWLTETLNYKEKKIWWQNKFIPFFFSSFTLSLWFPPKNNIYVYRSVCPCQSVLLFLLYFSNLLILSLIISVTLSSIVPKYCFLQSFFLSIMHNMLHKAHPLRHIYMAFMYFFSSVSIINADYYHSFTLISQLDVLFIFFLISSS